MKYSSDLTHSLSLSALSLSHSSPVSLSHHCPIFSLSIFLSLSFPTPDYESLRIGGLVFAVVLFALGILLILSKCVGVCVVCP